MCLFCGCKGKIVNDFVENMEEKEKMSNEISEIIVSYENEDNVRLEYEIDVKEGKRIKFVITEKIEEDIDEYLNSKELIQFIQQRIINYKFEEKKQNVEKDDEKIIWSVRVYYDDSDETFIQEGFYEYPEYWDELVDLIKK